MNKVTLKGHLGQDPEIRVFENGKKHARMSLAVNEKYINRFGEEETQTQWFTIAAWDRLADIAERKLHKGNLVTVEGKISQRNYVDKEGTKRYLMEIVANELTVEHKKEEQ